MHLEEEENLSMRSNERRVSGGDVSCKGKNRRTDSKVNRGKLKKTSMHQISPKAIFPSSFTPLIPPPRLCTPQLLCSPW
jgi:hypothetical protein